MYKIVLATDNIGKIKEISEIIDFYFSKSKQRIEYKKKIQFVPQKELNISTPYEYGKTYIENAIIKARHASKISSLPAISDDSGLEVDALGGKPGIFTARFAGENATSGDNINKLLLELRGIKNIIDREAKLFCVAAYVRNYNDTMPIVAQATWKGIILEKKIGNFGFGYDPIFYIPEKKCSIAELNFIDRVILSHRGMAFRKLFDLLLTNKTSFMVPEARLELAQD